MTSKTREPSKRSRGARNVIAEHGLYVCLVGLICFLVLAAYLITIGAGVYVLSLTVPVTAFIRYLLINVHRW